MSSLLAIIRGVWDWLSWVTTTVWDFVKEHSLLKWAVMLQMVSWIFFIISNPAAMFVYAADLITGLSFGYLNDLNIPPGVSTVLAVCNTFLPLAELCGYTIGYGTLLIAMSIYRFVKSMIPAPVPGGGGT